MIALAILAVLVFGVGVTKLVLLRRRGSVFSMLDDARADPVDPDGLTDDELVSRFNVMKAIRDAYFGSKRARRSQPERAAVVDATIADIQASRARRRDTGPA